MSFLVSLDIALTECIHNSTYGQISNRQVSHPERYLYISELGNNSLLFQLQLIRDSVRQSSNDIGDIYLMVGFKFLDFKGSPCLQ